jgi:hypothetical protein
MGPAHTRIAVRTVVASVALAVAIGAPASASASTVGQLFEPTFASCGAGTFLQTGAASGNSYTIPETGTITSWSFQTNGNVVPELELKVARPLGAEEYEIVGSSAAGSESPSSVNTYPASIPVHAGDVIGIYEGGGGCVSVTGESADTYAWISATNEPFGSIATYEPITSDRTPVSVEVAPPPHSTSPPTISGEARQGQTLTEAHGGWQNGPTGYEYQWTRCNSAGAGCTSIAHAKSQTYVPVAEDVGHTIRVEETATNAGGTTSATSAATNVVAAPIPATTATTTTSVAPTPLSGIAEAGGSATVRGGNAAVSVRCVGGGACKGTLELLVRVTKQHAVTRSGKRHVVKRTRNVVIGTAEFSIANGASEIVHVRLTAKGRRLLHNVGKRGLRVRLTGNGIKTGNVMLKARANVRRGKRA